jgi:hypothetical protein
MRPSWEQQEVEQEEDLRQTLTRMGEAESQRLADNRYYNDDYLGMDDGRPGLGFNPLALDSGDFITMDMRTRLILWVVGAAVLVVILVVGQVLKRTAGANTPSAPVPASSQQPGGSAPAPPARGS